MLLGNVDGGDDIIDAIDSDARWRCIQCVVVTAYPVSGDWKLNQAITSNKGPELRHQIGNNGLHEYIVGVKMCIPC